MKTKAKLSSEWIYKFYQELEEHGIENHGLIIEQGGEILFEEYAYPYSADIPHTLFSVTKSVVATAAGFAIDEGLVSLDTKIKDIFPEFKACDGDGWDECTFRSVLTMQSNKEFSFLQDMTGDYVEMFMKAPFRKKKGFLYSNNDAHMVAAAVQKLSGQNLVDYLMPRLFEPLGIEKPQWETNQKGECIGGTGAYLKLRDLVKISRCYADGGKFNGVQVIPEWWTKEATSMQVPLSDRQDEDGYGYLFWTHKGIFSMNGMYGQQISYVPEHDAVVASMNCVVNDSVNNMLMKTVLVKALEGEACAEWDEKLEKYLAERGEKPVSCGEIPNIPTGKVFRMTSASDIKAKFMFPASLIPRSLTSSFAKRPKCNLDKVSFEVTDDVFTVKWFEEEDEVIINCGIDGKPRISECKIKGYYYKIWAYAFTDGGKLKAVVKPINTLSTQRMTFDFSENEVKIQMTDTPSFTEFITKNVEQSSFVKNSKLFRPVIDKTVAYVLSLAEAPMKFKSE